MLSTACANHELLWDAGVPLGYCLKCFRHTIKGLCWSLNIIFALKIEYGKCDWVLQCFSETEHIWTVTDIHLLPMRALNPSLPAQPFCFLVVWWCWCWFCICRMVWRDQQEDVDAAIYKVAVSMHAGRLLSVNSLLGRAACQGPLGCDGACKWLAVHLLLWYGSEVSPKGLYAKALSPARNGMWWNFRK